MKRVDIPLAGHGNSRYLSKGRLERRCNVMSTRMPKPVIEWNRGNTSSLAEEAFSRFLCTRGAYEILLLTQHAPRRRRAGQIASSLPDLADRMFGSRILRIAPRGWRNHEVLSIL